MSELIATTEIPYENDWIYFCKKNEEGSINIYRSKIGRTGRKKGSKNIKQND